MGMMHDAVETFRLSETAFFTVGLLSIFILNPQDGDIVICRVSQIYLIRDKVFCFIIHPPPLQNFSLAVSKTSVSWNTIRKILI